MVCKQAPETEPPAALGWSVAFGHFRRLWLLFMADILVAGICTFLEIISFHLLQVAPPALLCPFPFPLWTATGSLVAGTELAIETLQLLKSQLEGLVLLTFCASFLTMFTITELKNSTEEHYTLGFIETRQEASSMSWPIPKWYRNKKLSAVILGFHQKSEPMSVLHLPFPFLFTESKALQKLQKTLLWHIWLPQVTCR